MAEVRCPNCGKSNPDILDVCQFCQSPLKPDFKLRIGDQPTKKNTGELEPILPDWLKDAREQARAQAEEEASQAASEPKSSQEQPLDFLAGLASQSRSSDEEDLPDWMAGIAPPAPPPPALPASAPEPPQDEIPSSRPEKDELSAWFAQAAGGSEENVEPDQGWAGEFDALHPSTKEPSPPQEEEDLSWLRNLEEASRQTGDLKAPKQGPEWTAGFDVPSTSSQPASSQGDLSWLDSLAGIEEPSQPASEQSRAPQDDLSWLDQLGAVEPVSAPEPPEEKTSSQEDLSWLANLGVAGEETSPMDAAPDQPISTPPFASEEELEWINNLGGPTEAQRPSSQEDLGWLKDLEAQAPAGNETPPPAAAETAEPAEPDWLRRSAEEPTLPAPGQVSMDLFKHAEQEPTSTAEEVQPAPLPDFFSATGEPPAFSNQDVDSLFATDMPEWLSRAEPERQEPASTPAAFPPETPDALAPVELPSWVQAMRPVEALISQAPSPEDQPEESEGPLAGLRGVLPGAPLVSALRPKAVLLKLQATDEQQANAVLLEEILQSETNPRALVDAPFVGTQTALRWTLAALFLVLLSALILLRSERMPILPRLPVEAGELANAVTGLPLNGHVLVVVDYEPALAGELEAIGAPLLEQMVSTSQPNLSFISTSPNGVALVDRLLAGADINTPDGFGYQAGVQYHNLGFLPGGSAGVLGFLEQPDAVIPGAELAAFPDYDVVVVMTDHAESARVWVEQLEAQRAKQLAPDLASQPLLLVTSAQAGPLLQPYVSSRQVTGMISGLSDAAHYETSNSRPGAARTYWDAFGAGMGLAVVAIVLGGLWSLFTGLRARSAAADQG